MSNSGTHDDEEKKCVMLSDTLFQHTKGTSPGFASEGASCTTLLGHTRIGKSCFVGDVRNDASAAVFNRRNYAFTSKLLLEFHNTFRLHSFRLNQFEVMNATMLGFNCFVLKPTGGGKSLCFQLPAIIRKGVTVVISPLRSLIQDQMSKLRVLNIRAACLTANVKGTAQRDIFTDLSMDKPPIKLLYVTPEKLTKNKQLIDAISSLKERNMLAQIVVDEAHCVSQWGEDFRPSYKKIGLLREKYPDLPMMAMTSTANPRVRRDILSILRMSDIHTPNHPVFLPTKWFVESFNRPNLVYRVRPKRQGKLCDADILHLITTDFQGQCGIVYCLSIKEAEGMASYLASNDVASIAYHGSLKDKQRTIAQKTWSDGDVPVVCATIAFGKCIT